ncbi:hypothetical protein B0T39_20335 [Chromobacterium haemolyticum]|nr:hypothetical protein B0T39_20335 [Chromobacterium haemolyticum]
MVVSLVAGITAIVVVVVSATTLWAFGKLPWQVDGANQGALATSNSRYVPINQIIVMLKQSENTSENFNYALLNLVLKAPAKQEAVVKDQSPNVQSVVVQALSLFTLEEVKRKSIKDLTLIIERALNESYRQQGEAKPFSSVQITKFLAE